jgi:hypothetical protein
MIDLFKELNGKDVGLIIGVGIDRWDTMKKWKKDRLIELLEEHERWLQEAGLIQGLGTIRRAKNYLLYMDGRRDNRGWEKEPIAHYKCDKCGEFVDSVMVGVEVGGEKGNYCYKCWVEELGKDDEEC